MFENSRIRAQAMLALRGHWQTALLVMFIASLPSLAASVAQQLVLAAPMTKLLNWMTTATTEQLADTELVRSMLPIRESLLVGGSAFLALLISSGLRLGAWHYDAELLHNRPGTVKDVFSRAGIWLKAVGLELWMDLKSVLWALPGAALLWAMIPAMEIPDLTINAMLMIIQGCTLAGTVLMVVLFVLARIRYAMAPYIMAERPETGVFAAVKESKAMMKGRKGKYFGLRISFFFLMLLVTLADNLISSLLGSVIGTVVYLLLSLVLEVYIAVSCVGFFLTYDEKSEPISVQPPQMPQMPM